MYCRRCVCVIIGDVKVYVDYSDVSSFESFVNIHITVLAFTQYCWVMSGTQRLQRFSSGRIYGRKLKETKYSRVVVYLKWLFR